MTRIRIISAWWRTWHAWRECELRLEARNEKKQTWTEGASTDSGSISWRTEAKWTFLCWHRHTQIHPPLLQTPPLWWQPKSSLNLSLSLILVNYSAALGNLPQGNVHTTNDSKVLSHVETLLFNRRSSSLSKSVDPMLRLTVVVRLFQRLPLDSTGKGVDHLDCAMLSQRASRDCCTPDFNIRSLVLVYFT